MSASKIRIFFLFPWYTWCILLLVTNVFGYPAPDDRVAGVETPISLEDLYKSLLKQPQDMAKFQLGIMILPTNDGDEFYNLREKVSPECQRTVRSLVKMELNLATQQEADRIEDDALSKTLETMNTTKQLKHPVELLCDEVETAFKRNPKLASVYSQLKKSFVDGASTATQRKHYFNSVLTSTDDLAIAAYSEFSKIPALVLTAMKEEFSNQLDATEAFNSTYYVLATAIVKVAKKEEFTDKVERIREKVFAEVAAIIQKSGNIFAEMLEEKNTLGFTVPMMEKFEKYLNEDPFLRRELNSEKQKIDSKN